MCLSICLCVCLCAAACLHYCMDPDVTWRSGRGCLIVVHYWADLQSVHGLRCYDNTIEHYGNAWQSPSVILQTHRTPHALSMRAACGEDSPHRRQNRRACCVRRSISSILRGWYTVIRTVEKIYTYKVVQYNIIVKSQHLTAPC